MNATRAYRGTILVVALGVLAVLAILGATMVKMARVDNLSARSFKYGTSLNLAVDSALEWLEYRLVTDYYMKGEGKYYSSASKRWNQDTWKGGPFDNPHDPSVPIALISPSQKGTITYSTSVTDRSLYLTSDGKYCDRSNSSAYRRLPDRWHNLPLGPFMAAPGESYSGQYFDGGIMKDLGPGNVDRLSIRVNGNRIVQVSLTVLDLCGRLNLNYHGDLGYDGVTHSGQSYEDPGILISEVAPNWATSGAKHRRAPYDVNDRWRTALSNSKRWGDDNKPELADMRMNQFEPSNKANKLAKTGTSARSPYYDDVPFGLEDLYELLQLNGTEATTRVERLWRRSFARTGLERRPDVKMYYKSFFTTHSWATSARTRFEDEEPGGLYVKADLNNGPADDPSSEDTLKENPLRMALLASGLANSYPNRDVDQIVANIMDYRDQDSRPRAINVGSYTVFGIDAQPYINEVFVDVANRVISKDADNNLIQTVPVYIELANPYEIELKKGESYSGLTYGASRTSLSGKLPDTIPSGGSVSSKQKGRVINFEVTCKISENPASQVWPVELQAVAKTTHKSSAQQKSYTILIDRFTGTGTAQPGQSWQRLCVRGKDRTGAATVYFGGWDARVNEASETCYDAGTKKGRFAVNTAAATAAAKIARPVENRSKTPEERSQKRYKPEEMSFYRIGDIARVMRIGHIEEGSTAKTVSERLAEKADASVRELHVDVLDEKYARIVNFVTVGSQFFDNYDNDGDGKPKSTTSTATTNQDEDDVGDSSQKDDNLGPEIYDMAKINLKTARPEVIRAMIPVQLKNRKARSFVLSDNDLWKLAEDICEYGQDARNNNIRPSACKLRLPTDILRMTTKYAGKGVTELFVGDGCDDDGNGAVDDYAERTWLYGYMSNWASTRSDSFAVYGTVRLVAGDGDGKVEGVRHFMAVLDRVPATAFSPYRTRAVGVDPGEPNKKYLGMRRVMMTWLD